MVGLLGLPVEVIDIILSNLTTGSEAKVRDETDYLMPGVCLGPKHECPSAKYTCYAGRNNLHDKGSLGNLRLTCSHLKSQAERYMFRTVEATNTLSSFVRLQAIVTSKSSGYGEYIREFIYKPSQDVEPADSIEDVEDRGKEFGLLFRVLKKCRCLESIIVHEIAYPGCYSPAHDDQDAQSEEEEGEDGEERTFEVCFPESMVAALQAVAARNAFYQGLYFRTGLRYKPVAKLEIHQAYNHCLHLLHRLVESKLYPKAILENFGKLEATDRAPALASAMKLLDTETQAPGLGLAFIGVNLLNQSFLTSLSLHYEGQTPVHTDHAHLQAQQQGTQPIFHAEPMLCAQHLLDILQLCTFLRHLDLRTYHSWAEPCVTAHWMLNTTILLNLEELIIEADVAVGVLVSFCVGRWWKRGGRMRMLSLVNVQFEDLYPLEFPPTRVDPEYLQGMEIFVRMLKSEFLRVFSQMGVAELTIQPSDFELKIFVSDDPMHWDLEPRERYNFSKLVKRLYADEIEEEIGDVAGEVAGPLVEVPTTSVQQDGEKVDIVRADTLLEIVKDE